MADELICVDDNVTFAGGDCERDDLVFKLASLLRGFGLVLRGSGEPVLILTADLPFGSDIFCSCAHVIAMKRVGETITQHGIDKFQVAHFGAIAQVGAVLRH